MSKTIRERELGSDIAGVIETVTSDEAFIVTGDGAPVSELRFLRAGRRRLIKRDEVAALAGANVRIDRERFRADLDDSVDQGL